MSFSERVVFGLKETPFQREAINDPLRVSLWNVTRLVLLDEIDNGRTWLDENTTLHALAKSLYFGFFKKHIDDLPLESRELIGSFRDIVDKYIWHEVFDFIEFLVEWRKARSNEGGRRLIAAYNEVLQKENSAYRFVNGLLVEVTSQQEIEEVERTFEHEDRYVHVKEHLSQALMMLSKRENPDYRNSIKESISAVESLVILVVGKKGTLGQLLKALEGKGLIPASLKNAYSSIYGYTCDGDGIRHALMDESRLSYAEARYMLIACSAFINYIIEREADIT